MSAAMEPRDADELLAEHAATDPLVRLALEEREPRDLTSQGEETTAGAPRVTTSTAGRAGRHPLGVAIVAALALAAVYLGVVVELTAPLMSGGQLIAGPVLIVGGGLLLARLVHVQLRRVGSEPRLEVLAAAEGYRWSRMPATASRLLTALDHFEERGDRVVQVRDFHGQTSKGEMDLDVLDLTDADHRLGVPVSSRLDHVELGPRGVQCFHDSGVVSDRPEQGHETLLRSAGLQRVLLHLASGTAQRVLRRLALSVGAPGDTPGADFRDGRVTVGDPRTVARTGGAR